MTAHERRLERLGRRLESAGVDALLVTNLTNVRYLTGFSGTNGQVLVTEDDAVFFSDERYRARAEAVVHAAPVEIYRFRVSEVLPRHLEGVARLGVEGRTMTLSQRDDLAERLRDAELVVTSGLVEQMRRVKDAGETALIREAVRVADAALAWLVERLAPGIPEREVALDLEIQMRRSGADAVAFDPIVGSGPLSAHIHHTSSERELRKGDLVLLDLGCVWEGYCSDLTRTVVLGAATDEQRALYDTVLKAQRRAIDAMSAGKDCKDMDAVARGVMEAAGHGDAFGHGLGHGVGLEIHEDPRMNRDVDDRLVAGDVVTVEPGIYIRDAGGVRIEDCVLVTDEGAEVLGSAPKDELMEL